MAGPSGSRRKPAAGTVRGRRRKQSGSMKKVSVKPQKKTGTDDDMQMSTKKKRGG